MTNKLYNLPYLKETRVYLRKNMTEAELVLWEVLKEKKLCGRKFRRQHSIGHYIADSCPSGRRVYCSSEKLIIELDGQHHYTDEGIAKDIERDAHLILMDKRVLRFENKDVLNNLTGVLKKKNHNLLN